MKTTSTDRPEMRLWLRRPRPPYALLMRRRRSERKRGKREGSGSEEGKRGAYLCRHCPHSFCSPTRTFFCTMSNLVSSFNVDSMIARNVRDYHYPHYPAADYLFTRQSLMFLCARAHSCLFFGGPQREVKCKGKEERCAWRASCTSSWEETQTGMYSSIFFEEKGLAGWLAMSPGGYRVSLSFGMYRHISSPSSVGKYSTYY